MRKRAVSSAELTFIFSEALKEAGGCSPRISVAVVPTDVGWKAVTNGWADFKNPGCRKRIQELERKLRKTYDLSDR